MKKVKIVNNRPSYWPILGCYKVDYSVDGVKGGKLFDTYKQGIEWIKETFPEWYKKHYETNKNKIT